MIVILTLAVLNIVILSFISCPSLKKLEFNHLNVKLMKQMNFSLRALSLTNSMSLYVCIIYTSLFYSFLSRKLLNTI